MSDDEFDALRDRIETIEAELGIDHDDGDHDDGDLPEGTMWVRGESDLYTWYFPADSTTFNDNDDGDDYVEVEFDLRVESDGEVKHGHGARWIHTIELLRRETVQAEVN